MTAVFYNTAQLEIIENAKNEHDWFTAIVLSAIQLEHNGCLKIKDYFLLCNADHEVIDSVLENFYLRDAARVLKVLKIIDSEEHENMIKINNERNFFVHRTTHEKFKRGKEADLKYDSLVTEAIRILKEKLDVTKVAIFPTK
ncbi:MAG: hypothetical protein ABR909_03020 [Candidatus Bathyarchaeia archaeon]|jgi:hypothetical protein